MPCYCIPASIYLYDQGDLAAPAFCLTTDDILMPAPMSCGGFVRMAHTSRRPTRIGISSPLLGLYVVASLALQASPVSVLVATYQIDRQANCPCLLAIDDSPSRSEPVPLLSEWSCRCCCVLCSLWHRRPLPPAQPPPLSTGSSASVASEFIDVRSHLIYTIYYVCVYI